MVICRILPKKKNMSASSFHNKENIACHVCVFFFRSENSAPVLSIFSRNFTDVVYVTVRSSRNASPAEMVRFISGKSEAKDHTRPDHNDSAKKSENVLVLGMERSQNCLQTVSLVAASSTKLAFL